MEINGIHSLLILQMFIILAWFAISNAGNSNIDCLRSIKESLQDPKHVLSSWNFSEGYICAFSGIECWHSYNNTVMNIRLSDMGLRGLFPIGIRDCTSLTGLDLSSNYLTGQIPSNIADIIPFVTDLDLSNNNLSGPIPPDIGNLYHINFLRLGSNQLTDQIPAELSKLDRVKVFNVSNNKLSGQVPIFQNNISAEDYANNLGLCGGPLSPCKIHDNRDDLFLSGFAVGFPVSTAITVLFILCCLPRPSLSNMRSYLCMIKKTKGRKHHLIPRISQIVFKEENNIEKNKMIVLEKYVRQVCLEELQLATNNFDIKNEISHGNTGIMYRAVFPNGLMVAVKWLHKFESSKKEFIQEIEILRRLRHINLIPLLCFCFEMDKKYLIYKYMPNGTLHQWLHSSPQVQGRKMGWTLRLKIAVGIARGLAWLHHNNILRVAHLRVNSKCILLDNKFEPKISNFGNSHILIYTIRSLSSPSSYKEDVYSFGVLLLELVSGRERTSTETDPLNNDVSGEVFNIVDQCLTGQGFDDEIYDILRIAKKCIQTHQDGAKSMLEVFKLISAIGISRNEISEDSCMDLECNEGHV